MKSQQEHLLSKYVGTGDADSRRHDVAVNHHRDTYAYIVSNADMLSYLAVASGESEERVRTEYLAQMREPCGVPPPEQDYNFLLADFMPKKKRLDEELPEADAN